MNVCFVDIGWIYDYHCLIILFMIIELFCENEFLRAKGSPFWEKHINYCTMMENLSRWRQWHEDTCNATLSHIELNDIMYMEDISRWCHYNITIEVNNNMCVSHLIIDIIMFKWSKEKFTNQENDKKDMKSVCLLIIATQDMWLQDNVGRYL